GRDRGHEVALPTWRAAQAEDWLGRWAMSLMLINVSTRKLRRAVRLPEGDLPGIAGGGTSKAAASDLKPISTCPFSQLHLQNINPSTSPNELNTTLTPHSMIHGDACFAYFNKIWGIPDAHGAPFIRPGTGVPLPRRLRCPALR